MARVLSVTLSALLLALVWVTTAQAQAPIHPAYSNSRAQIGNGLPIPITFVAPPDGKIAPLPGATVMNAPGAISWTTTGISAPVSTFNIGVFPSNNNVFEVQTSLRVRGASAATLSATGRTGPTTGPVTWCPGVALPTAGFNPACTSPPVTVTAGIAPNGLVSSLRYANFAAQVGQNQFGGVAQGQISGMSIPGATGAIVALKGANNAPCTLLTPGGCAVIFVRAFAAQTGAAGGAFGFTNMTPATPIPTPNLFYVSANAAGVITFITPTGMAGPPLTNKATSHGGPWTTGQLQLSAFNTANGNTEIFTLTGSDSSNTVNGTRKISLVAGAVSQRTLSKPNANRSWLNLYIPEPGAVLGAVGALLALVTCHNLVRRRSH